MLLNRGYSPAVYEVSWNAKKIYKPGAYFYKFEQITTQIQKMIFK
jgi:hypothetical protein